MKPLTCLYASLAFVIPFTYAGIASANPGVTGYSGKPYNGKSETCATNCHSGNGGVTVTTDAPATMQANSTATITITVNGSRARTSMNAAFSAGSATKGQNTDVPFPVQTPDEVGAATPIPTGANGTFKFTYKAPNVNGNVTMYYVGMSTDYGGGTGNDAIQAKTMTIAVSGATSSSSGSSGASGTSGSSGTDAGTSSGSSGASSSGASGSSGTSGTTSSGASGSSGTTSSSTSSGTSGASSSGDDPGDEGADGTNPRSSSSSSGGCATSTSNDMSAFALAGLTALGLVLTAKRRRK